MKSKKQISEILILIKIRLNLMILFFKSLIRHGKIIHITLLSIIVIIFKAFLFRSYVSILSTFQNNLENSWKICNKFRFTIDST